MTHEVSAGFHPSTSGGRGISNVSVALCTYNGRDYLPAQLESIASQSRLPDEVVVCDDASGDDTLQIVRRWADGCPFPVHVFDSDVNLGPARNFERAIRLCRGDVISLADQDDVWHPAKIDISMQALERSPAAGLVFADAEVVDQILQPLGYRMWSTRRFRRAEQTLVAHGRAPDVLIRRNVITGSTMLFRAKYKSLLLPIPENQVHLHDGWIGFLISAVASIALVNAPLMAYRQRPNQVIGAHPPTGIRMLMGQASSNSWEKIMEGHRATIDWHDALAARLMERRDAFPVGDHIFTLLTEKNAHLRRRLNMPRHRIPRAWFATRELARLGYHRYSIGIWAAAKDMTA